jgi:hypothetical protein
MSDIFISCATDDGMTAAKLAGVFRQEGLGVWWDVSTITPGANYLEAVAEELRHSKVVVLLWSRASGESRLVRLTRERAVGQMPVVVVLLEKAELLEKLKLPLTLLSLEVFDLSDWDGPASHAELQDLLRHVRSLIPTSQSPAVPRDSFNYFPKSDIHDFLRLPEIRAASQPQDGVRFGGVFISYRRGEAAAYAGRLYDRLAARFGKEKVFIDTENVGWGEDFVEVITSAAEACAVMIVLVSRGWSRGAEAEVDDYVRLEVATALGRKIRVMPILIQGASMPAPKELPEDLAPLVRRNALALSDTRWERDVEDLLKTLEGLLKD